MPYFVEYDNVTTGPFKTEKMARASFFHGETPTGSEETREERALIRHVRYTEHGKVYRVFRTLQPAEVAWVVVRSGVGPTSYDDLRRCPSTGHEAIVARGVRANWFTVLATRRSSGAQWNVTDAGYSRGISREDLPE